MAAETTPGSFDFAPIGCVTDTGSMRSAEDDKVFAVSLAPRFLTNLSVPCNCAVQESALLYKKFIDTCKAICRMFYGMPKLSTNQVAKKLGLTSASLTRYILAGKVAAPPETMAGGMRMRLWSESDIEQLRKALPKIANGRKTRYQKKQSAVSTQQSAKTKPKPQPGAAVPHASRKKKKKTE